MDEAVHYRRTAGRLYVRSAGPRLLRAKVLRWGEPVRLSNGTQEWFDRGSASVLDDPVELRVKHHGPRAGPVVQWRSTAVGFDALVAVDETLTGDRLLELVDEWGSLPISPAWVGRATPHSTGRQWHRVRFTELAVCHAGELPWGSVRRAAA